MLSSRIPGMIETLSVSVEELKSTKANAAGLTETLAQKANAKE
jgi:hypothetical protein